MWRPARAPERNLAQRIASKLPLHDRIAAGEHRSGTDHVSDAERDLVDWLRPATLMGHGDEETSSFAKGMSIQEQNSIRQQFKEGTYNLR